MKVIVRGVHLRVSRRLRQFVEEHLVLPLERFYDDEAAELIVELADMNGPKGGDDKECRAILRLPGLRTLVVTERSADVYTSVSFARDRLERQAKRELGKRRKDGGRRSKPAAALARGRLYRGVSARRTRS